MYFAATRNHGLARVLAVGFALIFAGGLLELATVPVTGALARLDEHRSHIDRLAAVADDARRKAELAMVTADSIDETWLHYDLTVQQLELSFETNADAARDRSVVWRRIVNALAAATPSRAIADVASPTAQDVAFTKARAAFLGVDRTLHRKLTAFGRLLDPRSHASTTSLLNATRDVRVLNASIDERWAAVSISAKAVSSDMSRALDDAQARLAAEQTKNTLEALVTP